MTIELWSLVGVVVALLASILIQAIAANAERGLDFNFTARDNPPDNGKYLARSTATVRNTVEYIAVFAPLVLVAHLANLSNAWIEISCLAAVAARFAYIPLYVLGIKYLRSVAWFVSAVPVVAILISLCI